MKLQDVANYFSEYYRLAGAGQDRVHQLMEEREGGQQGLEEGRSVKPLRTAYLRLTEACRLRIMLESPAESQTLLILAGEENSFRKEDIRVQKSGQGQLLVSDPIDLPKGSFQVLANSHISKALKQRVTVLAPAALQVKGYNADMLAPVQ